MQEPQTEPIIIIAGTTYPGLYKEEVFKHLTAKLVEEAADRKRSANHYH